MVALIGLYEENEKPEDPLNYLLSAIQSASGKQAEELQAVKEENEKLKERIAELEEKVAQMSGSGSEQVEAQPQQVSYRLLLEVFIFRNRQSQIMKHLQQQLSQHLQNLNKLQFYL